ncbi:glycoprotein 3-alpha-L-fucosyltransferase A isoform X1 [Bemisia tabaci]|uniref:glycoprotein 3-alpha-L-fucosyltransferase A isoform X1 n=1 Tax=Bemisia tabaci TaxID=7038 RepID=UPI003B2896FE
MYPRVQLRRKILIFTAFGFVCYVIWICCLRRLAQNSDTKLYISDDYNAQIADTNALTHGFEPADPESKTKELQQEAVTKKPEPPRRPWFMTDGEVWPVASGARRNVSLMPGEAPGEDRIANQLMYVPHNYEEVRQSGALKKILLYHGETWSWNVELGAGWFKRNKCPVDTCSITTTIAEANAADIIIFKDQYIPSVYRRPPHQVWMLYMLECPYHTQHMRHNDVFNWTATYRHDSDIVAPYEKWVYFDEKVRQKEKPDENYARQKSKLVAWFVSNCAAKNRRLEYAYELQKYIQVDMYGSCGLLKCPRSEKCFQMLDTTYKFYLAFENSNCVDYVTEKLFVNGLQHNVIPIVMGARQEDYANVAPYHSYIHVDEFDSPKHLAEYLYKLDEDEELYNSYFLWKGTGEFINTYFFCRVCAMIHADYPMKTYRNINEWWRGPGTCTSGSWKKFNKSETPRSRIGHVRSISNTPVLKV